MNSKRAMREEPRQQQPLVPRLRFPEFHRNGEWEQTTLGRILRLEYGSPLPEQSRRPGKVPVVGSNGIVGFHDEPLIVGPAIVVGRKGSAGEVNWVDVDCYPIDTAFYVESQDPKNQLRFIKFLLESSDLDRLRDNGAVPGINRNDVYSVGAALPKPSEQTRIADCLASLDGLIAAEKQKADCLKTYRRGLTQQLFPAHGETIPKLRFKEFADSKAWTKQKVSTLLQKVSRPVSVDPERLYQEIGLRSHGKGIFHKIPLRGEALGSKRVFWVEPNALVLNIVFAWEQAVATTSAAQKGMIASHRFPMYLPKENKCDIEFLKYLFLTPIGKHLLGLASPGGAGRNKTLGQKEFEGLELLVPSTAKEQTKIAQTLNSVDGLVSLQAERIERLAVHKKGLLKQLFARGEEVAE